MISMNQVWDDSVAFVRREAGLLVPVVLATVYLGDVLASVAGAMAEPGKPNGLATFLILAAALWSIVGQLSIVSLVLKAGQSVGEALQHGLSRLVKVLLVALALGLVISVALTPLLSLAVANGANPAKPESFQALPGWLLLVAVLTIIVIVWLVVRLALMNALIVDRNPGVIESLKGSFALTRGIAARLFLVILLYVIMLVILSGAIKFVAGSIFALIGAGLGSQFAGAVMTALVSGLVTAAMSLMATVFLANLYRRVSGKAVADVF
jgi:hypothetical protein